MMSPYIYDINERLAITRENVGTKGFYLSLLKGMGYNVPKTVFLSVKAFDDFLNHNGLREKIDELLKDANFNELEKLEKKCKEIKDLILNAEVPDSIRKDIMDAVNSLGVDKLAVRSSATSEDLPFASFAGMYDTYLNVPEEKIVDYVKKVWASSWNARALSYREELGIKEVKMGVIIQEFIDADKSGVVFSADVINMRPDVIIITSNFGLGEGIVSGEEDVDTFVIDKFEGKILEKNVQSKTQAVFRSNNEGTEKRELPNELKEKASLSEEEIDFLRRVTVDIEKRLRRPIDVEFIFKDGEGIIVQVRPITTFVDTFGYYEIEWKKYDDLETIWTNINIGELMPGIILPLTWSIMKKNIDYGFYEPFKYLSILYEGLNFTRLFAGRAYLNYDALRAIPSVLPGGSPEIMDELYLGGLPFEKEAEKKPGGLTKVKYTINMLRDMSTKKKESDRLMPKIDKLYKEHIKLDLRDKPFEEILDIYKKFDEIFEERHAFAIHIGCSAYALPSINMVKESLKELGVNLEENPLDKKLLIGLTDMESELASAKIWDLAKMVREDSALLEIFKFTEEKEILRRVYDNRKRFKEFIDAFEDFILNFGHRCVGEFKLENKRWIEDLDHVVTMIKHFVETDIESPYEKMERQKEEREKAEEEYKKLVKSKTMNPVKRQLYFSYLENAKIFVRLRENMKTALVKLSAIRRKYILEIAKRLIEKGLLTEENEIFYLTNSELMDLIDGKITPQVAKRIIENRKKVYKTYPNMIVPDIIKGYLKPEEVKQETKRVELGEGTIELTGIPGSPGSYKGKAVIVNDPREISKMEKGDVLVASATDLGWTPLYLISGALIVEIGSVLSHGAIIAREYGIPAVMNVKNATKIIEDGDMVEVDGYNGTVRVYKKNRT